MVVTMTRFTVRQAALLGLLGLSAGCVGTAVPDDVFSVTCTDAPCDWEVRAGKLEATGSWHPRERAFAFVEPGTEITRLLPVSMFTSCYRFELIADVEVGTELSLSLDFNDDGLIEQRLLVPPVRWGRTQLHALAPGEYHSLRLHLRKAGEGRAALAYLVIATGGECAGPAITLADGAPCASDATCSTGRCLSGMCASCPATGCAEGQRCGVDADCADGGCAGGLCSACAKAGTCPPRERCSSPAHCAFKSCTAGAIPGKTSFPTFDRTCGACAVDSDCPAGACVLGQCSACSTDAECAGQACRYADAYDALERACLPPRDLRIPRGALCESDLECEANLRCSASPGLAKRCGGACTSNIDCGQMEVCASAGARRVRNGQPELAAYQLLPSWADAAARISTCHPIVLDDGPCDAHDQCLYGMCCAGRCSGAALDLNTGECVERVPPVSFN
jgi:hypothetical protein